MKYPLLIYPLSKMEKSNLQLTFLKKFASVVGVKLSQIMYFSEELTPECENDIKQGMITRLTRPLMFKWLKTIASHAHDEE